MTNSAEEGQWLAVMGKAHRQECLCHRGAGVVGGADEGSLAWG